MNASVESGSLQRVVGVGALGFNAVNLTIAVGIFGLPAAMAAVLGHAAVIAYLVCAVLFGLVGLCLAEAGSRVGRTGGLYAYASIPFGPVAGAVAGTLLWAASGASASAAIVNLLIDTLSTVLPALATPAVRVASIVAIFAVVALINVRGVRYGVRLSVVMTIIKIAPLVLLAVAGAFHVDPAQLRWTGTPSLASIGDASLLLFYAFIGVECALSMSGELVRPARTVPLGILLGLSIITALYVGLQLVAQGTLGDALKDSKAPLIDAAKVVFGPWGGGLLLAAMCLSAGGCIAADLLSSPRVPFAFAEQRQLPKFVAAVHPRYGTPYVAILLYAAVCTGLALSGSFRQLAVLSSAGTLILYFICCCGVLMMRARNIATEGKPFIVPGGPVVPLLAVALIIYLLWHLSAAELRYTFGFVAIVAAIFAFVAWRNASSHPQ